MVIFLIVYYMYGLYFPELWFSVSRFSGQYAGLESTDHISCFGQFCWSQWQPCARIYEIRPGAGFLDGFEQVENVGRDMGADTWSWCLSILFSRNLYILYYLRGNLELSSLLSLTVFFKLRLCKLVLFQFLKRSILFYVVCWNLDLFVTYNCFVYFPLESPLPEFPAALKLCCNLCKLEPNVQCQCSLVQPCHCITQTLSCIP